MNDTIPRDPRSRKGLRHNSRIYVVTAGGPNGQETHLVRAIHPGIAMRHVAQHLIQVRVATQDDLVQLTRTGVSVQDARNRNRSDWAVSDDAQPSAIADSASAMP